MSDNGWSKQPLYQPDQPDTEPEQPLDWPPADDIAVTGPDPAKSCDHRWVVYDDRSSVCEICGESSGTRDR